MEGALTSSLHREKTQADGITSQVEVQEVGDAKLPGNRRRRWARHSASKGATAAQEEMDGAAAKSAPQASSISSSNVDATPRPSVDNDGQLAGEGRRLKKALREIESLKAMQNGGGKLRRNQVEEINKK